MRVHRWLGAPGGRARLRVARVFTLVIIAAALIVGQSKVGQSAIRSIGFRAAESPFFALYFSASSQLPTEVPKTDLLRVAFGVQNTDSQTRSVSWSLVDTSGTSHVTLASGSVTIPGDHIVKLVRVVRPRCAAPRTELVVALAHQPSPITLWLTCSRK